MADSNTDPFADVNFKAATDSNIPKEQHAQPLGDFDRLIMSALFDTQPKRRAKYLAQRGWELDPKDENKIRPMGSKEPFIQEIDPGGMFNFKQYMKPGAGAHEAVLDSVEGLIDFVQGAVIEAVGQVGATSGAAAVGAPTLGAGAVPGALAGRSAARIATYNLIEKGKDILGDFFFDNNIPPDMALRGLQTAIQAVAPEILAKGGEVAAKTVKGTLGAVKKGFINLVTMGGGKVDDIALKGLAQNPHLFDSVDKGGKVVQDHINELFGIAEDAPIPRDFKELGESSAFKQGMAALEAPRKEIVTKLSAVPQANVKVQDAVRMLQAQIDAMPRSSGRSQSGGDIAVNYLQDRIKRLVKDHGMNGQMTFSEMDELVRAVQQDAYNRSDNASGLIRQAAATLNNNVKNIAESHAQVIPELGDYASIKAKEAKIFDAFESASSNINKKNMLNVIIGGAEDQAPTAFGKDVSRNAATTAIKKVDDALGTQYYEGIRSGQLQNNIFQAMQAGKVPQGSAGAIARGVGGFAAGNAMGGPGLGALTAAGTVVGGMPQVGLPIAAKAGQAQETIQQSVINPLQDYIGRETNTPVQAATNAAIEAASKNVIQPTVPKPEEQDPFADITF